MQTRLFIALLFVSAAGAFAQVAYVDSQGRQWRQVADLTGHTWDQVASVCPTDGDTPCSGLLGNDDLTGWTWATRDQVLALFAEFAPEILDTGTVSGPNYTLPGLGFTSTFEPTWEFYTTVGGFFSLSGWSATEADGQAFTPVVSASYNPNDGGFSVQPLVDTLDVSSLRGVWLYQAPADDCAADLSGDGELNFFDISAFLGFYDSGNAKADLDGNGSIDFFDLSAFLTLFAAGCP